MRSRQTMPRHRRVAPTSTAASVRFEQLETRNLFAGNVTVVLVPGSPSTVQLTGDNANNAVTVFNSGGDFTITGQAGTTITYNGVTGSSAFIGGQPYGSVSADLGNGNDEIHISGGTYTNIAVQGGNGNDLVDIFSTSQISGNLDIDTGNGDDTVSITFMQASPGTHWNISTGNGDDSVTLDDVSFGNVAPGDSFHVLLGNGDDTLTFGGGVNADADSDTLFDGGNGKDTVVGVGNFVLIPFYPIWSLVIIALNTTPSIAMRGIWLARP